MNQSTQIEQCNAIYDGEQDRILLRFRINTGAEFRFWLTRRYVNLLWGIMMKISGEFSARKAPCDFMIHGTLAELAHGNAVNKANFSSAYHEGSEFPLGETPILLAKISFNPMQGDKQVLSLFPQDGQGINLTLDENLLHVLARLIHEVTVKAEWGLELRITGVENSFLPVETTSPRMLH